MTEYYNKYIQDFTKEEQEDFYINSDLTSCDKCGLIQKWDYKYEEIYCKGDDLEEDITCGEYDVLCSDCYYENSKSIATKIEIAYYVALEYLEGVRQ
ncbi:MAG TPA: hypothetical protein DCM40_32885 [Maribacter sp.]|nr:hypothetical protein [Maribacter sp.]